MTEKVKGSVKWFSNKKGYGFITPVEGSPITDDIFVHQSAIHSEGYRTLVRFTKHFFSRVKLLVHGTGPHALFNLLVKHVHISHTFPLLYATNQLPHEHTNTNGTIGRRMAS